MAAHVIKEDLGIHQIAVQVLIVDIQTVQFCRQLSAGGFQIHGRQMRARAAGVGGLTF